MQAMIFCCLLYWFFSYKERDYILQGHLFITYFVHRNQTCLCSLRKIYCSCTFFGVRSMIMLTMYTPWVYLFYEKASISWGRSHIYAVFATESLFSLVFFFFAIMYIQTVKVQVSLGLGLLSNNSKGVMREVITLLVFLQCC